MAPSRRTACVRASGPQLTQITQLYNSTMLAGLNAANLHVIRLNMFGLYNEVTASPGAYGFTNATGARLHAHRPR